MLDWKFRRQTFYSLISKDTFTDLLDNNKLPLVERFNKQDIITDAINYVTIHNDSLFYPGKSYAIAIMYASWIEDFFGDDFYKTLNDPELLFDDKYFVPYYKDKETYDHVLKHIDLLNDVVGYDNLPYVQMTRNYFLQEFMLDEFGKSILPFTGIERIK
jgi:hypothetical protein